MLKPPTLKSSAPKPTPAPEIPNAVATFEQRAKEEADAAARAEAAAREASSAGQRRDNLARKRREAKKDSQKEQNQ